LTVWSPLSSGFLSGKYTRESLADPGNRYSGFDILPFDKEHGFRLVERMRAIASSHGASVAQVALAWLLSRQAVTSVILGASKMQQLEDNLGSVDVRLAATPLSAVYPNWFNDNLADRPLVEALRR
jgi:aryl-alcohol dehydrogenase-like predicted oxidoreductase